MKQVKIYGLPGLIMISSMNAISQKKTGDKSTLSKQFDKTLSGINKININNNKAVKQFAYQKVLQYMNECTVLDVRLPDFLNTDDTNKKDLHGFF